MAKKLETDSAEFYRELDSKFGKEVTRFHELSEENKKNITQMKRAYYGMISDVVEGCFTYNIDEDNYAIDVDVTSVFSLHLAIERAIDIEKIIQNFYSLTAEQSGTLMADIQRIFKLLETSRTNRIAGLYELV